MQQRKYNVHPTSCIIVDVDEVRKVRYQSKTWAAADIKDGVELTADEGVVIENGFI